MKLGLISDVHGDVLALELAWAHLTVLGADRIVCAGDVVGYGPHPDRVVAFLAEHQIVSARGNHDRWALERAPGSPDEFGGGTPSVETLAYLKDLEFAPILSAGPRTVVVAHGSPGSDMDFVTQATHPPVVLRRLLARLDTDVLVVGHTHQPMWYRGGRGLVVNPGSVISIPVVRTSRTFALLDLETLAVTFHDVETGRAIPLEPWGDEDAADLPRNKG